MASVAELQHAIADSTERMLAAVAALRPAELSDATALAGWTRGHVVTHLARNADAIRVGLLGARAVSSLPMYASRDGRDADIDAGSTRPPAVIVGGVEHACRTLACEIDALPTNQWSEPVELHLASGSTTLPALALLEMRLREVEIHHVDLAVGYDFGGAPAATLDLLLTHAAERLSGHQPDRIELTATDLARSYVIDADQNPAAGKHRVDASAAALLGHLTERGPRLGDVPALPAWG